MAKSLRPASAVTVPDSGAAQQFYVIGEAQPEQVAAATTPSAGAAAQVGADLAAPSFSAVAEAKPDHAGAAGGLVLDVPVDAGPGQAAAAVIFPADSPPTVEETQYLLALKDGSMFVLDADMLSGDPLALRDALGAVGIVFGDPEQGSDVLDEYGLSGLLGGWLLDFQAASAGGADLGGHSGIF